MNRRIERKLAKRVGETGVYNMLRDAYALHCDGDYRIRGNGWRIEVFRADRGPGWRSDIIIFRGARKVMERAASHTRERGGDFADRVLAAIRIARRMNRRAGPDVQPKRPNDWEP